MADEIENNTGVEDEHSKEEKLSAARKKYAQLKKQRQKKNKKNKESTENETEGGSGAEDTEELGKETTGEEEPKPEEKRMNSSKEEEQDEPDKKQESNLQEKLEAAQKESENARKELDVLRHQMKSIQEKYDDLQVKSSQVSKKVQESDDKLAHSEKQNTKLKKDIVELTNKKDQEVAELQNELTTSKHRIEQLENDIRKNKANTSSSAASGDDEEKEIFDLVERDRLRSQVAELSDLVADLRGKLRAKRPSIGPYETVSPESGQIPLGDDDNNNNGFARRGSSLFSGSKRVGNNNRPRNTSFAEVNLFDDSIADSYEQASRRATELRREIGRWTGWQVDLREYFVPPVSGLTGVIGPVFQV